MDKTKINKLVQKYAQSDEERMELNMIIDEIIHHRLVGCILDNLAREHHEEFLQKLTEKQLGEELIAYLEEKSGKEITLKIKQAVTDIETEILQELN